MLSHVLNSPPLFSNPIHITNRTSNTIKSTMGITNYFAKKLAHQGLDKSDPLTM